MATVAVVIPVYATPENHRLDFLGQTLRSVHLQTYRDLVALVVDDGSTANVEGFVKDFGYDKLRYVKRTRSPADLKTASNALNFGIDLCLARSHEVFTSQEASNLAALAYLHSDDLLPPQSVHQRIVALKHDTAFGYGRMVYINSGNRIIDVSRWKGEFGHDTLSGFPHHSVMWSLEFAERLKEYVIGKYGLDGIFDTRLSHGEDLDVSLSSAEAASQLNLEIVNIPEIVYAYRRHMGTISGSGAAKEYLLSQHRIIEGKHFLPQEAPHLRLIRPLQRMAADIPWSLGYMFPEPVKRRMRPIRDIVKEIGITSNRLSDAELRGIEAILATPPSRSRHSLLP